MKFPVKHIAVYVMALCNAATQPGVEPTVTGTVVLVDVTKDEVVFAADSRGGMPGSHDDVDCKIMAFKNDAIFASAGMRRRDIRLGDGTYQKWDSHEVAKEAFRLGRLKRGNDTLAALAAEYWANRGKRFFQLVLSEPGIERPAEEHFSQGAFASVDKSGNLSVYTAVIILGPDHTHPVAVTKINHVLAGQLTVLTHPEIIQEFSNPRTFRSIAAVDRWKENLPIGISDSKYQELWAIQLTQWTIDFSTDGTIGGDVNAIVLTKGGLRWGVQKDYCKAAN
jgi:hypothetical protein